MDLCLVKTSQHNIYKILHRQANGWYPLPERTFPSFYPITITPGGPSLPREIVQPILKKAFFQCLAQGEIQQAAKILMVHPLMIKWFYNKFIVVHPRDTFFHDINDYHGSKVTKIKWSLRTLHVAYRVYLGLHKRQKYIGIHTFEFREHEGDGNGAIWFPHQLAWHTSKPVNQRGTVPNPAFVDRAGGVTKQVSCGRMQRDVFWIRSPTGIVDYQYTNATLEGPVIVFTCVNVGEDDYSYIHSDDELEGTIELPMMLRDINDIDPWHMNEHLKYIMNAQRAWKNFEILMQHIFGPQAVVYFQEHEAHLHGTTLLHRV